MRKGISISLIPNLLRRVNGLKTVSSGVVNRTILQSEFVETCRRYQEQAAIQVHSFPDVVNALWRTGGLTTTLGKCKLTEDALHDPHFPRESLGIAHVGYGATATQYAHFDIAKLNEMIQTKCEPNYRGFAQEGVGSILRIYEPGLFKWMAGLMGLIPRGGPPGPDRSGFYYGFFFTYSPEVQRLITHGYGRQMAFSKISVYKAIQEAMGLPSEHIPPCVQGIAFAFAFLNSAEMPRLLENSNIPYPETVRAAFQNGLVYCLTFCEWFAPGLLAGWRPQGRLEEKLIALARVESALNLKRGYPLAFWLENPIVAAAEALARV